MENAREPAAGTPDGTRERLLALERRVDELERDLGGLRRGKLRTRLYLLIGAALYLLFLWWEMTQLG